MLAATLLDGGLVDEVGMSLHPVLLGDGIPMFPRRAAAIGLEPLQVELIAYGCTYPLYRVVRDDGDAGR